AKIREVRLGADARPERNLSATVAQPQVVHDERGLRRAVHVESRRGTVDLGQHVTQGQLMAIIETPEVDQQLQVAEADLKSAQANLSLADTTAQRYQNLLKSDSVSKQE